MSLPLKNVDPFLTRLSLFWFWFWHLCLLQWWILGTWISSWSVWHYSSLGLALYFWEHLTCSLAWAPSRDGGTYMLSVSDFAFSDPTCIWRQHFAWWACSCWTPFSRSCLDEKAKRLHHQCIVGCWLRVSFLPILSLVLRVFLSDWLVHLQKGGVWIQVWPGSRGSKKFQLSRSMHTVPHFKSCSMQAKHIAWISLQFNSFVP